MKISRILHAGYLFESEQTTLLFDPIFENPFSRNCHAFPAVQFDIEKVGQLCVQAIFISHYHDDHCSFESLALLNRDTPIYLYCLHEEMFSMLRALGFQQIYRLNIDHAVTIGSFVVTPRRALADDIDCMFHLQAEGMHVLNVVDALIAPEDLPALTGNNAWDMVLWPYQTMRELDVICPRQAVPATGEIPEEWIEQLQALAPRYVVASACQFRQESWSWYNHAFFPITYQCFMETVANRLPGTTAVRLNPSVSVELTPTDLSYAPSLEWVTLLENPDVDYDYQPSLIPPDMAEIANHFPALLPGETDLVIQYCTNDLPAIFHALDPTGDLYFEKSRLWRLSLYDQRGHVMHFHFRVHQNKLSSCDADDATIEWTTEICQYKLHAALTTGETLTSLYMRINDFPFNDNTRQELEYAEIVDDPLIRCLFNEKFGAYQRDQLAQLGIHYDPDTDAL